MYVCLYHLMYIHTASTCGDANTRRYIDISTHMHQETTHLNDLPESPTSMCVCICVSVSQQMQLQCYFYISNYIQTQPHSVPPSITVGPIMCVSTSQYACVYITINLLYLRVYIIADFFFLYIYHHQIYCMCMSISLYICFFYVYIIVD